MRRIGSQYSRRSCANEHGQKHLSAKHVLINSAKCGVKFTVSTSLVRHERSHDNEKTHSCQHCSKAFSQVRNKSTHEALHRGVVSSS
ncbi:hypothetical protein T484DRAFT_1647627 [Baffinella frigidus]|nr:hypothetical protein T484DRAFT_1647627 [Cryptophyta sp. CCMP2293]